MSQCKGCGSQTKNCGAPIWEDVCTNKECTYDADQFKLQMREQGIRMRNENALRDAATELYDALTLCVKEIEAITRACGSGLLTDNALIAGYSAISKARGEHK